MKKIWMTLLAGSVMLAACDNKTTETESAETNENQTVAASMEGHEGHNHEMEVKDTPLPSNTVEIESGPAAKFEFVETTYEYGEVKQGDVVEHTFKFKNVGEVPLIIQNATASCGCTVPNPPKEPIAVGETAEIDVRFDTKGKIGMQNKRITINANTNPPQTYLEIRGNVMAKSNMPEGGPLKQ